MNTVLKACHEFAHNLQLEDLPWLVALGFLICAKEEGPCYVSTNVGSKHSVLLKWRLLTSWLNFLGFSWVRWWQRTTTSRPWVSSMTVWKGPWIVCLDSWRCVLLLDKSSELSFLGYVYLGHSSLFLEGIGYSH